VGRKARQREAEEFMVGILRSVEEQDGVPAVLFHAYADAIDRYKLEGWRPGEDRRTAGETNARTREYYQQVIETMAAYTREGGRERWDAFDEAVCHFAAFAGIAVEVAHEALRTSGVGFSEPTDPAFAGLVEQDVGLEQACVDEGLLVPAFGGMLRISKKGTEL
jgi:hypothetical protein